MRWLVLQNLRVHLEKKCSESLQVMIHHNMNGEWFLLFIIFFSVKVLYVDSSFALLPPSYRHTLNYGFKLNSKKLYPSFLSFFEAEVFGSIFWPRSCYCASKATCPRASFLPMGAVNWSSSTELKPRLSIS